MFRIGEFSKLTQVSIRMLRHYDEMNLLKPAEIDENTKYRLYSVEQIPTLNTIVYLRDSGFQVAEIAEALQSDKQLIVKQLDRKYMEVQNHIEQEKEKLEKIKLAKHEIRFGKDNMHEKITIKTIPSYSVLALHRRIANYYEEGTLWKELSEFAKEHKVEISDETFSIYHDEDYREESVDVELCVVVQKPGIDSGDFKFYQSEAVPTMACMMVYGDFAHIAGAYQSFANWLQIHKPYRMLKTSRQIVHRGPWNEADPKKYLIEIQIPIETIKGNL